MQKQDKQGKDVMWCFVEFDEVVQAARCMKVLQASPAVHPLKILYGHRSDILAWIVCQLRTWPSAEPLAEDPDLPVKDSEGTRAPPRTC